MQVRATAPVTATPVGQAQRLGTLTLRVGARRPATVRGRVGANRLATLSVCVARWLLPWACVLTLSAVIAHATEQGLSATLLPEQAPRAKLAPDGVGRDRAPAPAGSRWVTISAVDADGVPSSIACLTRVELLSADVIAVQLEGLDLLVSELCSDISR